MEKAFYFENEEKSLFAILHSPSKSKERKGIIFCHPYGEEKQLSYRVLVNFARELCNKGFYVLRFDCFGYGDSQGDFEDATIETQISDTIKSIDFFKSQLKIEKIGLLGLRLGGTISALVAEQDTRIEKLILWSPIISGKVYLNELFGKKLFSEFTIKKANTSKSQIIEEIESKGLVDIEGHYLTRQVYEQLLGICLTTNVSNFKGSVLLCTINGRPKLNRSFETLSEVYKKRGALCNLKFADDKIFWDSGLFFEWYFPTNLYEETLKWITRDLE
ncbi:MAG: alpha/beta fold hydrolase [Candidatus Scalinduaceae bacterium]